MGFLRLSVILLCFASLAAAMTARRGEELVTVKSSEVIPDTLFATGKIVQVEGTVEGDLIVFAERLQLLGKVNGNVIAFTRQIEFDGEVQGSIASFSRNAWFGGNVERNIYAFAQNARAVQSAQIGGDLTLFAQTAESESQVKHGVQFFAQRGILGGNVDGHAQFFGRELRVTNSAKIDGSLVAHVSNEQDVQIASGAVIGGPVERIVDRPNIFLMIGMRVLWEVMWFIAAFLTGWLLWRLAPRFVQNASVSVAGGWRSPVYGLGVLILVPIVLALFAATVVGLPVALIGGATYISMLYVSKIIVAFYLGDKLLRGRPRIEGFAAGLLAVTILCLIPFGVGLVVRAIVACLGIGGMVLAARERSQPRPVTTDPNLQPVGV